LPEAKTHLQTGDGFREHIVTRLSVTSRTRGFKSPNCFGLGIRRELTREINNIRKTRFVKFPSSITIATVGDSEKIQFYGNKLWTNFRYKFWRNAKESQNKDKVNEARADREKIIEIMKRAVRRTILYHEQAGIILPIEKRQPTQQE